VNMSRVHPDVLAYSDTLKIAGTKDNAVGIMLGMTTECCLVKPGKSGPVNAAWTIYKITIMPFPQEFARDQSMWGQHLGFTNITGSISQLGISFSTRKDFGDIHDSHGKSCSNI
jgi:hypothetical protein